MKRFSDIVRGVFASKRLTLSLTMVILILLALSKPLAAQDDGEDEPSVQILTGQILLGERLFFDLPDLQQGDTLYVQMSNVSGNLDPTLLLTTADVEIEPLIESMRNELAQRVAAGEDSVEATREVLLANFLTGNDNFGANSTAAFAYEIPVDDDYLLVALGALTNETAGGYELVVGLNAPQVLEGNARATGDELAFLDREASGIATSVQETQGKLSAEQPQWYYTIPRVESGDTLYAYVEALSEDLKPVLELQDYSGRSVRLANELGLESQAAFEFPVPAVTDNYRIIVRESAVDPTPASGNYRLLVGTNEPAILTGEAETTGRRVISGEIPVTVQVQLQQIAGVDQKAENYVGVYYLQMDWHDPSHAFNPDDCLCQFKTFIGPGFNRLISDEDFLWPNFTVFNQQNNRWTQNNGIILFANGDMRYYERFTTTLQAPDFNFRAFPFDTQQFYLHLDQLYPQTFYRFDGPAELSSLGQQLGEEEWQVSGYTTEVSNVAGLGDLPSSRFSFGFQAHRHLNFYIMRIFLPTLLIIIVSYFTFFLKDYSKRIDVTSANLLVFVAFNFTISDELPRLGYLTFMDAMLASVFVVTALVIAFNVYLRRLELNGKGERARKIDSYTLWVYPTLYIVGGIILTIYFLMPDVWNGIVESVGMGQSVG